MSSCLAGVWRRLRRGRLFFRVVTLRCAPSSDGASQSFQIPGPRAAAILNLGVHVLASGADFEEFPKQVEDATAFLLTNVEQI